jgi:hypothetical protein
LFFKGGPDSKKDKESVSCWRKKASVPQYADCLQVFHISVDRLAYDRAAILVYGDEAETNYPPEESEHVVFSPEIMQQINAAKGGQRLH